MQSFSHVRLFVTPLIAWQPPQSSTVSRSLLRFMSIESVMSFSYLIQSELVLGTRTRGSNSVHSLLGSQCPLWGQAVACKKEKKKKVVFFFVPFYQGLTSGFYYLSNMNQATWFFYLLEEVRGQDNTWNFRFCDPPVSYIQTHEKKQTMMVSSNYV